MHFVFTIIFVLYLNLFDDLSPLSVTNMQKNKKSVREQILFHSNVFWPVISSISPAVTCPYVVSPGLDSSILQENS